METVKQKHQPRRDIFFVNPDKRSISRIFFILDILGIILSFSIVYKLILYRDFSLFIVSESFFWRAFITLGCLYIFNTYKLNQTIYGLTATGRTIIALLVAGIIISILTYILEPRFLHLHHNRKILAYTFPFLITWTTSIRFLYSRIIRKSRLNLSWLVITDNDTIEPLISDLKKEETQSHSIKVLVDDSEHEMVSEHITGSWYQLDQNLTENTAGIILATKKQLPNRIVEKLMHYRFSGFQILDLCDFYEKYLYKIPVFHLKTGWFVLSHGFTILQNSPSIQLKKLADRLFALLLLLLLAPLFPIIALIIKLDSRGPVFFKQIRTGKDGKDFYVYKFRSMVQDAEKDGAKWAEKNDSRVTFIGKILRKSRVDELPQLWNVFIGDMSFIGPRPERPEFNEKLTQEIPFYNSRHTVRPGITGWAQVNYPYGASVEDTIQKLQYDFFYIKNYSLFLDIAIIFKTLRVILFRQGQ